MLLVLVVVFMQSVVLPVYSAGMDNTTGVVDALDRNKLEPSSEEGSSPEEWEDPLDNPKYLDVEEIKLKQKQSKNRNTLDTIMFTTGVVMYTIGLIYSMVYTFYRINPEIGMKFIKLVTLGRYRSMDRDIPTFFRKMIGLIVLGTLFSTGIAKTFILWFYGFVLSKIQG